VAHVHPAPRERDKLDELSEADAWFNGGAGTFDYADPESRRRTSLELEWEYTVWGTRVYSIRSISVDVHTEHTAAPDCCCRGCRVLTEEELDIFRPLRFEGSEPTSQAGSGLLEDFDILAYM
jgi:hypothetical protein